MNKIILIENTTVLKQRIENIINSTGHSRVESYSDINFDFKKNNLVFENAKLIIINIDVFDFDVKEFMNTIRKGKQTKEIPVILVSAHPDKSLVLLAAKYGKTEILLKPFTDMKLLEKTLWNSKAPTLEKSNEDVASVKEKVQFSWNDDFKIGIEQIDDEHKLIIDHFEKLYKLMSEGKGHEYYDELLTFLVSYIDTHFSNEERYHIEIEYPDRKNHIKLHRVFTDKIRAIIEKHKESAVTNGDLISMNLFIKQWLLHHILVIDKKVANYINPDED